MSSRAESDPRDRLIWVLVLQRHWVTIQGLMVAGTEVGSRQELSPFPHTEGQVIHSSVLLNASVIT